MWCLLGCHIFLTEKFLFWGCHLNFDFQKFSGILVSFKFDLAYLQNKKKIRVELKNKRNKDKMIINVRIKKNRKLN